MDFIRRALLFSKVKIGRTLLLILTFSAILIFVLSGLIINHSAQQAIETAKKETGATVTLAVNREAMMAKARETATKDAGTSETPTRVRFEMTPVPLSEAEKIAQLSGVKSYSFTKNTVATKDSLQPITSTSDTTENTQAESQSGSDRSVAGGMFQKSNMNQGDFSIVGVNELKNVTAFSDGSQKIISGRGLTATDDKTNAVVIENDLAKDNHLKVGDTFTIKDKDDKSYTMTIVGIYQSTASVDSMAMNFAFMNVSNRLYTSLTFANTMAGTTNTIDAATYNLTDPDKSEDFVKAAQNLIDTETYSVTSNDAVYQQMLTPLNNVAKFAKNIVLLVAIAGTIILSLIVILTIRERRGEIGILMSMGEKRIKVIGQFFVELLIVMLLAVGIAGATGNLVGNVVGQQLLASQTAKTTDDAKADQTNQGQGNFNVAGPRQGGANPFRQSQAEVNAIDKLKIKVSSQEIAYLACIAFGIVSIAILVASLGIIRLNPKDILTGA